MSGARRQNLRGEPIARNKASRGSDPSRADRNFLASPESVRVDILKVSEVSDLSCPIRHPKIRMEKFFMKLALLEGSRTIDNGVLGCGEICSYDVGGLLHPPYRIRSHVDSCLLASGGQTRLGTRKVSSAGDFDQRSQNESQIQDPSISAWICIRQRR